MKIETTDLLIDMQKQADDAGATHTRIIRDKDFIAYESVIASCAANTCGNYGKCWTCPPMNGTFEFITEELSKYKNAILIQNISPLEDSYDFDGMQKAMKVHNDMIRDLNIKLKTQYPDNNLLILGCGGCGYCEKCSCPDSPCNFPDKAISSLEGYGIEVRPLVLESGLKYINGVNTVSYVGLILTE